jgi:hypothetical protein
MRAIGETLGGEALNAVLAGSARRFFRLPAPQV